MLITTVQEINQFKIFIFFIWLQLTNFATLINVYVHYHADANNHKISYRKNLFSDNFYQKRGKQTIFKLYSSVESSYLSHSNEELNLLQNTFRDQGNNRSKNLNKFKASTKNLIFFHFFPKALQSSVRQFYRDVCRKIRLTAFLRIFFL